MLHRLVVEIAYYSLEKTAFRLGKNITVKISIMSQNAKKRT
ncbi:hypothetical protein FDUTEX481_04908 [Tolypothrix sp. PCC 7601]|nr:hypothetical protein [Tolypothrix sp. PCC 7712]EKE97531.1 hypothetical protein FDUTEX481_04908 [Tolypothrix sp. PCC 7601]